MKRFGPWLFGLAAVGVFACYLALTAGTRIFLPESWDSLDKKMSPEEAEDLIPELRFENHFEPSEEDFHVTSKRLGLRDWTLVIHYRDGQISDWEKRSIDPHTEWMIWLRSRLQGGFPRF